MTTRFTKPEINIREKLNELDYARLPHEKLPSGSIVQMKYVTRSSDISTTTVGSWANIDSIEFAPIFKDSILELSVDYSMGSQAGVTSYFRFTYDDPTTLNTVEIERTGGYVGNDINQDAWPARNNWVYYYKPNSTETRTYRFEGNKSGGAGIIWYHTYGSGTTSIFTIREIKQ
jgi:hypothetical protein